MPCNDGYRPGDCSSAFSDGVNAAQHNSPVAEMLCMACRHAENKAGWAGILDLPGVAQWWKIHKARDAAKALREKKEKEYRRQQDEAQFRALAKKLGKVIK